LPLYHRRPALAGAGPCAISDRGIQRCGEHPYDDDAGALWTPTCC